METECAFKLVRLVRTCGAISFTCEIVAHTWFLFLDPSGRIVASIWDRFGNHAGVVCIFLFRPVSTCLVLACLRLLVCPNGCPVLSCVLSCLVVSCRVVLLRSLRSLRYGMLVVNGLVRVVRDKG